CLKGAVVAAMTEPTMIHVKRDRLRGNTAFLGKVKSSLGVNESANQPSRRASIDARPGPGHPDLSLIISDAQFAPPRNGWDTRSLVFGMFDQFFDMRSQVAVEEIHRGDFLKAAP